VMSSARETTSNNRRREPRYRVRLKEVSELWDFRRAGAAPV